MPRRSKGEGTIYQRADGRWAGQVTLPDGKRKTYYGKTKREAGKLVNAAIAELAKGLPLPSDKLTTGDYLTRWHEARSIKIDPSSHLRYGSLLRNHLLPGLGKTPLTKLRAQEIELFYARKVQSGLSTTTVRLMHTFLHGALKAAHRQGLVARNESELLSAPQKAQRQMQIFSEEQARFFLESVAADRFSALYVLALTTGMREGELVALHWKDIHFDQRQLVVSVAAQETKTHGYILAEPKTAYSRRTIALSEHAIEALHLHKDAQEFEHRKAGNYWQSTGLVFCTEIGGFYNPHHLIHAFKKHLKAAGLSPMRFHDLRHTAATLLISRGVNVKVVSEMLGHSSVVITLQIYAHVLPQMQTAAAAVMDAVFSARR